MNAWGTPFVPIGTSLVLYQTVPSLERLGYFLQSENRSFSQTAGSLSSYDMNRRSFLKRIVRRDWDCLSEIRRLTAEIAEIAKENQN
jgi:hypothetical protein